MLDDGAPPRFFSAAPGDGRRIAVVSHTHPSVSKGGAEIAAYALFRGLRKLGADALFVAGCDEKDRGRLHLGGADERILFHEPERYEHFYQLGAPAVARELAALLAAERVGVANFHHYLFLGLAALRAAKLAAGAVTVATLHEYLAICHHHGQMVTRPARALCERASPESCGECFPEMDRTQFALRRDRFLSAFGAVDRFVSPSRFLADRHVAWGLEPDRIEVIENGLAGFNGAAPRRPRAPGAPWVFGYFGQINQFKGVDVLLRACDLLAERKDMAGRVQIRVHGNLVGQAPAFVERFEKAARDYPFLSYAGPYSNSMVRELMAACDYVVVPSTWWENSPLVIQEAFAARCPVVCSGIGGMAEKVEDKATGLHFRPGDAADLLRAFAAAMHEATHAAFIERLPVPDNEVGMARRYLECFGAAVRGGAAERSAPLPPAAAPPAPETHRTPKPRKRKVPC